MFPNHPAGTACTEYSVEYKTLPHPTNQLVQPVQSSVKSTQQSQPIQLVPSSLLISSYFSAKIFFLLQTFFMRPHLIFRCWNLYRMCPAIVLLHFALRQCLSLKILVFLRVTNLGYRHLISSPSQIIMVQRQLQKKRILMPSFFCDQKILENHTKWMTHRMGL